MSRIIRYCRERGTRELIGDVLMGNRRMLELANALGFSKTYMGYQTTRVTLSLNPLGNAEVAGG